MDSEKDNLRNNMFAAYKEQKMLLTKRDLLLSGKTSKAELLQITHKIAKLEDFIRMAENTLKMSD